MSYKIIGKYIKDLNFSIPNPKTFFLLSKSISNYKINIDIKSAQVKQNIIEVLTSLSLTPNKNDFEKHASTIIYLHLNCLKLAGFLCSFRRVPVLTLVSWIYKSYIEGKNEIMIARKYVFWTQRIQNDVRISFQQFLMSLSNFCYFQE